MGIRSYISSKDLYVKGPVPASGTPMAVTETVNVDGQSDVSGGVISGGKRGT